MSPSQSSLTPSSKPVLINNVLCSGTALMLLECGYTLATGSSNDDDVVINCRTRELYVHSNSFSSKSSNSQRISVDFMSKLIIMNL